MGNLPEATASPVEVEIMGRKYELYPMRITDWSRIEQWMRSQIIEAARESLRTNTEVTALEKQQILRAAMREAVSLSVIGCFLGAPKREKFESDDDYVQRLKSGEGQTMSLLQTFEGMLRMIHLSMRDGPDKYAKPKYGIAELNEIFGADYEALTECYTKVIEISLATSGGANEDDKGADEKNPLQQQVQKKKI